MLDWDPLDGGIRLGLWEMESGPDHLLETASSSLDGWTCRSWSRRIGCKETFSSLSQLSISFSLSSVRSSIVHASISVASSKYLLCYPKQTSIFVSRDVLQNNCVSFPPPAEHFDRRMARRLSEQPTNQTAGQESCNSSGSDSLSNHFSLHSKTGKKKKDVRKHLPSPLSR